jgi:aspartyl-tRNA(Asn)/glutamyl-tRNA(Gln) amidotransferase subunit A
MQLADLSAVALLQAYAERSLSPVEMIDAVLDRIDAVEPTIQALYAPDPAGARRAARDSEQRWRDGNPVGPLDGVPITIKENIATRGTPVPMGTAATVLDPAAEDAPPAARTREAGAILLAKTTMPDYGMLSSGLSSFHGLARNPWNPSWTPGGSSAGAAAAAAAGYGPLHLGSDIGGSLRLPASWTGVATLKPSLGRVPIDPPYPARVVGPLARTVNDAALLMGVLSAPDPRDHMSLPFEPLDWSRLYGDVSGLRVGLWTDAGCGLPVEPEVAAAVEAAGRLFAGAGAVVEPVAPFFTREMLDDIDLFWRVRCWADFSALSHQRQAAALPYIADWCRGGADVPGVVLMRCLNRMLEVRRVTVAATGPYDYVLSPVSPVPAFAAELPSPTDDVRRPLDHIGFTVPFSMSEQPASSVNCGFTGDGRPVGLQVAGRRFDDLGVLRVTRWYEQARPAAAAPIWPPAGLELPGA